MDSQSAGSGAAIRFEALDSLRGICALAVALFHFQVTGLIANLPFFRMAWLFVDFFFVLSGFVIAHSYGARLIAHTTTPMRFLALRFGRIYPMHLAMLLVMIALELLLTSGMFGAVSMREPFSGSRSVEAIFSNIFLLHSFGVDDQLTWNGPSWSIAAEMWMYALFSALFWLLGKRARHVMLACSAVALAALVMFSDSYLNTTFAFGFLRCVYGFGLGVFCQTLHARGVKFGGNFSEILSVVISIAFVTMVPYSAWTYLAPVVFGFCVLGFAEEKGLISRALKTGPMLYLGMLSYSIYMVHTFVQARIGDLVKMFGRDYGLTVRQISGGEAGAERIVAAGIAGDILAIGMMIAVVVVSALTYKTIERPWRDKVRGWLSASAA